MCYFEGMDAYIKAWLVFLSCLPHHCDCSDNTHQQVVMEIWEISRKMEPGGNISYTSALSFTKLLRAIIDALPFTSIGYVNETHSLRIVWLSDASVRYFSAKHAPLGLTAIAISITGLLYTIILFSWQWLQKAPNKWIFKWTRNTKLNLFMEAYLAPYKAKYRYWTGLLLLIRIAIYFGIATNKSHDNQTTAIVIGITFAGVVILRTFLEESIYRHRFARYLSLSHLLNLLVLCIIKLHCRNAGKSCQIIATRVFLLHFLRFSFSLHSFTTSSAR